MEEKKLSEALNKKKINEEHLKIDLPFDLNNLFNLSYSFDTLKVAIEWLARQ
jgi:hypothetical protein